MRQRASYGREGTANDGLLLELARDADNYPGLLCSPIDQRTPLVTEDSGLYLHQRQSVLQVLSCGTSGRLTHIDLQLLREPGVEVDIQLKLLAINPADISASKVVCSAQIAADAIPCTDSVFSTVWITTVLAEPRNVEEGQMLGIHLSCPELAADSAPRLSWALNDASVYPRGNLWQKFDNEVTNWDDAAMAFRTRVLPA